MSTLKVNNLQVGQDSTATNNLTWFQPGSPDGTIRLGSGNAGSATTKFTFDKDGNLTCVGDITANSIIAPIEGTLDDWIVHAGDTNTKFGFPADDTFTVETGGSERLHLKSDGTLYTVTEGAKFGVSQDPTLTTMGSTSGTWQLPEVDASTIGAEMRIGDINSNSVALIRLASYGSSDDEGGGAIMFTNTRLGSALHHSDLAAIKGARETLGKGYLRFFTANQAANAERMRITSDGKIGMGIAAPLHNLHIKPPTASETVLKIEAESGYDARLKLDTSSGGGAEARIDFEEDASIRGWISYTNNSGGTTDDMVFGTATLERLRITSSGYVGVKRSSPLANLHTTNNELAIGANPTSAAAPNATYDGLVVDGEAGSWINIRSRGDGNSAYGRLAFSDDTRGRGHIEYRHKDGTGDDWMGFQTAGAERLRITSGGTLAINKSSGNYSSPLHIVADASENAITLEGLKAAINWRYTDGSANRRGGIKWNGSTGQVLFDSGVSGNGYYYQFDLNGSERLRIKSDGDLLLQGGKIYGDDGASNTFTLQSTSGNNNHSRIEIGAAQSSDNGGIHFYTAGSSVATRHMTLKGTSGNLGIGVDNPTEKLHVDVGAPSSSNKVIGRFQAESSRKLDIVWHDDGSMMGFDTPGNHAYIFKANGSEKVRFQTSDGQVLINKCKQYHWGGSAACSATWSVQFTPLATGGGGNIYHIKAYFTHHSLSYGAYLEGVYGAYNGHTGLQIDNDENSSSSSAGGSWDVTRASSGTNPPVVITPVSYTHLTLPTTPYV